MLKEFLLMEMVMHVQMPRPFTPLVGLPLQYYGYSVLANYGHNEGSDKIT